MGAARLIAFEGVDGAGKTTALHHVAALLRAQGVPVFLPRMGKEHVSRPTRMIRQLTRDVRNFELSAPAELLLYCAREAQVLGELVRPALARGETVLIDRSLLTPVVLGMARGLSQGQCEEAAALAAGGLQPDLTLVFDVHPRTSRMRKRIERVRTHTLGEGGRKGLAGSALKERVRDGYARIARERGLPVFHVERASPEELARRVARVVREGAQAGTGETPLDATPRWLVREGTPLLSALHELPVADALFLGDGLALARELRRSALDAEPALVAFTLDQDDPLRVKAAEREPDYALRGLLGRPLAGPDDLRLLHLSRAPAAALVALRHLGDAQSDALRRAHVESQPDAVLSSLAGREDDAASALRQACWKRAEHDARATSLVGCAAERAWTLRHELYEDDALAAARSLRGVADPRGDAWLLRLRDGAPKLVLSALAGRTDARAHELRLSLFETGREVIDTVRRLGDEPSFSLRQRALPRWPSTVAHSLLGLPRDARVRAMIERCRAAGPGDLHVLRRLALLQEQAEAPAPVEPTDLDHE